MKQGKPASRREKASTGAVGTVNRKAEQWNTSYGINSCKLTSSQTVLYNKILDNTLVFVEAPAGTGKSYSILYSFVKEYINDNTKQIIIIRTPVEAGLDKIGALPDSYNAKVEPHFASTKKLLENFLNRGKVETDFEHRIHFKIPNFVLGATFDNSLILVDEAQQLPPNILKLLLERTGVNSKVVIAGDNSQLYATNAGSRNGLKDALPRFFDKNMNSLYPDVAYHHFTVDDVMRSDIVKTVITAYQGL